MSNSVFEYSYVLFFMSADDDIYVALSDTFHPYINGT